MLARLYVVLPRLTREKAGGWCAVSLANSNSHLRPRIDRVSTSKKWRLPLPRALVNASGRNLSRLVLEMNGCPLQIHRTGIGESAP